MPAFSLTPDGNGYLVEWTVGGGSRPTLYSDGSDATYVNTGGVTVTDAQTLSDLPSGAGRIVGDVSATWRLSKAAGGAGTITGFLRYSATNSNTSALTAGAFPTFTDNPVAFALDPTGAAWSVPAVNGLEIGCTSSYNVDILLSQMSPVTGNYELADGGFVFLLSPILGAIGGGLMLSEMPKLAAYFRRLSSGKWLITPDEYRKAWAELRAYRHPRFA